MRNYSTVQKIYVTVNDRAVNARDACLAATQGLQPLVIIESHMTPVTINLPVLRGAKLGQSAPVYHHTMDFQFFPVNANISINFFNLLI